jgi:hypothetical protein
MPKRERKKLNIKCTDSDCTNNLHCFKPTKKLIKQGLGGKCRTCKADLVDWSRVHKKEILDAGYTFKALKFELIRHEFWHRKFTEKAKEYANKKGLTGLQKRANEIIKNNVAPINNPYDGRQTPIDKNKMNPIHYAQHATATCCRTCIEYWHGIPKDKILSKKEKDYLVELIMLFIEDRLPLLKSQQSLNL